MSAWSRIGQWSSLIAAIMYFGLSPSYATCSAGTPIVILVRHADKAPELGDDPPLSASGLIRAEELVRALVHAKISKIITTQFARTRDTARPIATALSLTPDAVAVRFDDIAPHIRELETLICGRRDEVVLVVGHGDTVPALIAALGGPPMRAICETSYANLFILIPSGQSLNLVRARYGAPDPEVGPDCSLR